MCTHCPPAGASRGLLGTAAALGHPPLWEPGGRKGEHGELYLDLAIYDNSSNLN